MFIITNTIRVKTEFREKMFQQFKSSHTQEQMVGVGGFINFEVFYRDLPDEEGISEVVALSRWENEKDQLAWVNSSSFKSLHKRPKKDETIGKNEEKHESPVLGNKISRYHTA